MCSSTDALQASVSDLRDVQVVEDGTAALEDAVDSVRSALQDVVDDATSQYATQVDGLQASFDDAAGCGRRSARCAVRGDPRTPSPRRSRALANEVTGFADDIASTC